MKETNVAIAIDAAMTSRKANMVSIYRSLERDHDMTVNTSWCGIEAFSKGRRVYKHGTYTPEGASTPEQRTRYRLRLIRFVRWLFDHNIMTPELEAARSFFEDQDEW